jgi:hypothetical protein
VVEFPAAPSRKKKESVSWSTLQGW